MPKILSVIMLTFTLLGFSSAVAQQNIARQAYAIFEQNCLNCHGPHGAYTEQLVIDSAAGLVASGAVVPGNPIASELYTRLLLQDPAKRMPLGQPRLPANAILTIGNWIKAGAVDWETPQRESSFITPEDMLGRIERHVNSLSAFDRRFARYFTMTHLYNAGETTEALHAYQRALSKLVNSLSWGREVIPPQPIDPAETIFYIDLRDYEWELGSDRWTQIEAKYPYHIDFNAPLQKGQQETLKRLRQTMDCEIPFIHVDWFLATASLPPLYHDILDLPKTDRELEAQLEVNVAENIRNAPGKRVWRAGLNDSRVSKNNRVVERHVSRYGAYWKSYDFAGSVGSQNIFTHPLSFEHDGGEIIFNLPNGLQAYYLTDAEGKRLEAAPINIVSNPAASDPTVRNGLSCIGCHTKGMQTFTDEVREVIKRTVNPPFNKERALRLYTDQATMDVLIDEDTQRYRQALEATGGVLGGIEPVQRFNEAFSRPLDAAAAATSVGLETQVFLERIRQNVGLQNLGLLVLENGTIKRDTWTSKFSQIVSALDFPQRRVVSVDPQAERIPGAGVSIPDPNLRAAIAEVLGKALDAPITAAEMAAADFGNFHLSESISDLTGLEYATTLVHFSFGGNQIPDLSPLADLKDLYSLNLSVSDLSLLTSRLADAGLTGLKNLGIRNTNISDLSPLTGLTGLISLSIRNTNISDILSLAGLTGVTSLYLTNNNISDVSPLAGLTELSILYLDNNNISDISPLSRLTKLRHLGLDNNNISDVSPLAGLTELSTLELNNNNISDISPLTELTKLWTLDLRVNNISDLSPLRALREKGRNIHWGNNPGFREDGIPIEGSWLWMVVPQTGNWRNRDGLALASGNAVTELGIATSGAAVGSSVGDHVWTAHKITIDGHQHLGPQLAAMGMEGANRLSGIVYASTFVDSPREQETLLFIPEGYAVKVWVNGVLLSHSWRIGGDRSGRVPTYVNFTPVTLKAGKNILLFGSQGGNSGLPGFAPGTEYTASVQGIEYTFSHPAIYVGDIFTLDISTRNITDFAGWQFDIAFDPAVLEAIEVNEGDFLKKDAETTFFRKGKINNQSGRITGLSSARLSGNGVTGTGTLASVTFKAKAEGETQLGLNNFQLGSGTGEGIAAGPHEVVITIEGTLATGDVNKDGEVSILDMILIARHLGETAPANSAVDVNDDGVVNVLDLIVVSQHFGESVAAAPSLRAEALTPAMIQAWIERAELENDGSIAFQLGIANLQKLLASLIPEETALLANYPNPFNPETWIPYDLAKPGDVTLTIYSIDGTVVRWLNLGHQPAGMYHRKSRAAYWDGRNAQGEKVASGLYFYTLSAGDFTATRKMLIRK